MPPAASVRALPADAVDVAVPAEFQRFPALAHAVAAVSQRHRRAFEAAAAAATARGADVSGWRLRIHWRVILGNRYLRVAQGDGTSVQAGVATPILERITYDGVSGEVLAFADWFDDPGVWPVIAGLRSEAGQPAAVPGPPSATSQPPRVGIGPADGAAPVSYEPVFSADGPVMGFDLLYAPEPSAPASAGMQRVRIPIKAVAPFLDESHRPSLAAMAGSG